jgi:predicted enzyme related to lactoylglutathione lyase
MKDESFFCHIVIPAVNLEKSKVFYREVFGWIVEKQEGTSSWDVMPRSRKGPSAELNPEEKTLTPAIHTTDIKAALNLIEKHGGKTLKGKTAVGENAKNGYLALFEDPGGNRMCLYSES